MKRRCQVWIIVLPQEIKNSNPSEKKQKAWQKSWTVVVLEFSLANRYLWWEVEINKKKDEQCTEDSYLYII